MDIDRDTVALIFGVLSLGVGIHGLLFGRLGFRSGEAGSVGGSSGVDFELVGLSARIVALIFVVAGMALFFSPTLGFAMLLLAMLLPWLVSRFG